MKIILDNYISIVKVQSTPICSHSIRTNLWSCLFKNFFLRNHNVTSNWMQIWIMGCNLSMTWTYSCNSSKWIQWEFGFLCHTLSGSHLNLVNELQSNEEKDLLNLKFPQQPIPNSFNRILSLKKNCPQITLQRKTQRTHYWFWTISVHLRVINTTLQVKTK